MKEDYELIAEFMGYELGTHNNKKVALKNGFLMWKESFELYKSDWNMLMGLVEKIMSTELEGGKYGKTVDFQISNNDGTGWIFWLKDVPGDQNQPQAFLGKGTLIEKTYYAVMEFIKWQNQQNPV